MAKDEKDPKAAATAGEATGAQTQPAAAEAAEKGEGTVRCLIRNAASLYGAVEAGHVVRQFGFDFTVAKNAKGLPTDLVADLPEYAAKALIDAERVELAG